MKLHAIRPYIYSYIYVSKWKAVMQRKGWRINQMSTTSKALRQGIIFFFYCFSCFASYFFHDKESDSLATYYITTYTIHIYTKLRLRFHVSKNKETRLIFFFICFSFFVLKLRSMCM